LQNENDTLAREESDNGNSFDIDLDEMSIFNDLEDFDNDNFLLLPDDSSPIPPASEGEPLQSATSNNADNMVEQHEVQNFDSFGFPAADDEAPLRRSSRVRKATSKLMDPTNQGIRKALG
jgi:hypothetical protein